MSIKCDYRDREAILYNDEWAICGECPDTKPPETGNRQSLDTEAEKPGD
jgi:hypothetical protein